MFNIYFAGEIFDHKHLVGNKLLADALEHQSEGTYKVLLPQDHEQTDYRAVAIRDQDLKMVIESDLCIFNFDGGDVDSGTVVEFMLAKMLDIPSLIIRTDFRSAGDGLKDGDPWNLMLSGYPRTEKFVYNGMALYQLYAKSGSIKSLYANYAEGIITELDKLRIQKSIFNSYEQVRAAYRTATIFPGASFSKDISLKVPQIIDQKIQKNIYQVVSSLKSSNK